MPLLRAGTAAFLLIFCARSVTQTQVPDEKAEAAVNCHFADQLQPQLTPYALTNAALISLWYARQAGSRGEELKKEAHKNDSAFTQVIAMMRLTKVSTNDFVCAKRPMIPFTTKENGENTQTAAKYFIAIYNGQIVLNQRMIDLLKNLDSTKSAELADQMSTLQVERGQLWSELQQPTLIVLLQSVNTGRPDEQGGSRWLVITKAQKQALLSWAYEHFPELKDGTPKDKWSETTKTAGLYIEFLNGRRGSDESVPVSTK
jgi:hypothetical protein